MRATSGILQLLSPAELEGVFAHELTHIINRDVMVMTLASFFASLAAMIMQFGLFFGGGFGGGGDNEGEGDIGLVILVAAVVYAVSFLLRGRSRATASSPPTAARRSSPGAPARWPRRCSRSAAQSRASRAATCAPLKV